MHYNKSGQVEIQQLTEMDILFFAMGNGDRQTELTINQFDTHEGSREGIEFGDVNSYTWWSWF